MLSCIILAGGAGTRLWPLSVQEKPKQFLTLFKDESMLVQTSNRVSDLIPIDRQFVLTGENYAPLVDDQFYGRINILAEPMAKNTAPCILWATLRIKKYYQGGTVVVMPSDHIVKQEKQFHTALETAIKKAQEGCIVTFGIEPTHAETGYGYIEIPSNDYTLNTSVEKLIEFHEKPNYKKAKEYIEQGNYLWNSGMFVFDAQTMIDEFKMHAPEVYGAFANIDIDSPYEVMGAFERVQAISVDYAVMEKTSKAFCIPSKFGWSDVGGYESLYKETVKDENMNACVGENITLQDTANCYICGDKKVVCIGVEGLVVIQNGDNVLIADMKNAHNVGEIAKKFIK